MTMPMNRELRFSKALLLALSLSIPSSLSWAQSPSAPSSTPSVAFRVTNALTDPKAYELTLDSSCQATYRATWPSEAAEDPANPGDTELGTTNATAAVKTNAFATASPAPPAAERETSFAVSKRNCRRIFYLIHATGDLQGNFDYTHHKVSSNGDHTVVYFDGRQQHTASFRWSENAFISELSALFEGMGTTIESGRRLRQLLRYDKLGLNRYLARMEDMAKSGWIKELHVIDDVLGEISSNPSVMDIARARAQRLAAIATKDGTR